MSVLDTKLSLRQDNQPSNTAPVTTGYFLVCINNDIQLANTYFYEKILKFFAKDINVINPFAG